MTANASGWRQSKWLIIVELAIFAGLFAADLAGLIPFSKTPFLLVLVVASWLLRRVSWRDMGFRAYRNNWLLTLALGVIGGAAIEAIELYVSQPFLVNVMHEQPDLSDFNDLHGNLTLTLIYIGLAWTLAAIGEEVAYRGYLQNRIADLFAPLRGAAWIGLVLMSVAFGFAHGHQGPTGVIDEGFMGLLLGLMYLGAGRNIIIPIVAHGVQDTIDVLLLYSGTYPMPGVH